MRFSRVKVKRLAQVYKKRKGGRVQISNQIQRQVRAVPWLPASYEHPAVWSCSYFQASCAIVLIHLLLVELSLPYMPHSKQPEQFSLFFLLLKCSKLFTSSPSHHLYSRTKSTFPCSFYEALGPVAVHLCSFSPPLPIRSWKMSGICFKCFPMVSRACA